MLDCTLRDGGYLNDWNFGYANLISILERLVSSGVDIIEIGFLDERRSFDKNRSIMPTTDCVSKIYGNVNKRKSVIVGMIDYGTCSIECLQPCSQSYLDGIRVIFKKHLMYEALEFCSQVKSLGYKVFAQMVSITSYSDQELEQFIDLANKVNPYAVSIVDTYGLLYKDNLLHYFEILDAGLDPSIKMGYHSHNNFQLAYSNCMEVLRHKTQRSIVLDGTLYGMGKSAGNAPLELLAMYLNEHYGKSYDISQVLEAIDGNIMKIHNKTPWGYNLFFYLAASNACHPNYVQFLMNKHSLSICSVNQILQQIDNDKKLLYDQEHIEKLYYYYQKVECDDSADIQELKQLFKGREIVIVGPGVSIKKYSKDICEYIRKHKVFVISVNFVPEEIPVDYIFLTNPRRYIRLIGALRERNKLKLPIIATSNVTKEKGEFDFVVNNSILLDTRAEIMDNSFIMLLKLLLRLDVELIACVGMDGYSKTGENYVDKDMEYWFSRQKSGELNTYVKTFLKEAGLKEHLHFVTPSHYQE